MNYHPKKVITHPLFYFSTLALAGCSKTGNHNTAIKRSMSEKNLPLQGVDKYPVLDTIGKYSKTTTLGRSALNGNLIAVKCLTQLGADVNAQDCSGNTALHLAAKAGCLAIVEELLGQEADITIRNQEGNTAFHVAVQEEWLEIVDKFLDKETGIINIRNNQDIHKHKDHKIHHLAEEHGDWEISDELRNKGNTALHLAIQKGHKNMVIKLLDRGANTTIQNNAGYTPLHLAIAKDTDETIIKLLVEKGGIDLLKIPTLNGVTALHLALDYHYHHHQNIAKLFVEKGDIELFMTLDNNHETALHLAVHHGNQEIVEPLVKKGGMKLLKMQDEHDRTALHVAACDGRLEILKCLIEEGKATKKIINIKNNQDKTALQVAKDAGHTDIVNYLQKKLQSLSLCRLF